MDCIVNVFLQIHHSERYNNKTISRSRYVRVTLKMAPNPTKLRN